MTLSPELIKLLHSQKAFLMIKDEMDKVLLLRFLNIKCINEIRRAKVKLLFLYNNSKNISVHFTGQKK